MMTATTPDVLIVSDPHVDAERAHNDTSPACLPIELQLDIIEQRILDGPDAAHQISQVCQLFRHIALPLFVRTLSPVEQARQLVSLPEHLLPYVQNVWMEDGRKSAYPLLSTSWIWESVPNLAIRTSSLYARMRLDPMRPILCTKLTLLPSDENHYRGLQIAISHCFLTQPFYLTNLTHLQWCATRHTPALPRLLLAAPCLTHVALPFRPSLPYATHIVLRSALVLVPKKQMMVVIVLELSLLMARGLGGLIAEVENCRKLDERLYLAPGAVECDHMRKEWEQLIDGGEDVWQRAARLRKAVLAGDVEQLRREYPLS
ncbi:hypothetical protein BKA93DRAFT_121794 [Sparassis latifolia]